ncbi:MAG: response regulator, partial [Deltaproteobacteria bacterium]|nr:response regulator [Deltaproteobacteria bacterium]
MNRTILVVEDDRNLSLVLSRVLQKEGYEVAVANTVAEGKSLLNERAPGIVLTDVYLPDGTGLEILESAKSIDRDIDVIVKTANATGEAAIAAMKKGAHDYLLKPFQVDELVLH